MAVIELTKGCTAVTTINQYAPDWVDTGNVFADDGAESSISMPSGSSVNSDWIVGKTFGAIIGGSGDPSVTINSLTVRIKMKKSNSYAMNGTLMLHNGTSLTGTAYSFLVPASASYVTITRTNAQWGISNDTLKGYLNNDLLGVGVKVISNDLHAIIAYIDYIEIIVNFNGRELSAEADIDGNDSIDTTIFGLISPVSCAIAGIDAELAGILANTLPAGNIYILGTALLSNMEYITSFGEILDGSKYLSPAISGVTIVKSSTLPTGSYLTKFCYLTGSGSGGESKIFVGPPSDPNYSNFIFAYALNGGARTRVVPGSDTLVRDKLGNWVVIHTDYESIDTSSETSTVLELDTGSEMEQPWITEPPFSTLMFEDIARQVYGNANLGILLRQIFVNDFESAKSVILPDASDLSKITIKPESHIWERFPSSRHYEDTEE